MASNKPYAMGIPEEPWRVSNCANVSLVLTEDCNLRCRYCYMVNKSHDKRMTFDIGRRCLDFLIENYSDKDAVVLDFIGGEPTLEIDLLDELVDYWKLSLLRRRHKWLESFHIGITTNGILYDTPAVQSFVDKNREVLEVTVTIDGTPEMHNANRVFPDGRGSYSEVVRNVPLWLAQFPEASTKVTISRANLPYLKDSILHLWGLGIKSVPANPTFEESWNCDDAKLYKQQIVELADVVVREGLWKTRNTTLFADQFCDTEQPISNRNWCGCGHNMIAFGPDGVVYPCIRLSKYSLSYRPARFIGHIDTGIDPDLVRAYECLTFHSQSPAECLECKITLGCAWCQGLNYDVADTQTVFQRSTRICEMHKARHEANLYLWDKLRTVTSISPTGEFSSTRG